MLKQLYSSFYLNKCCWYQLQRNKSKFSGKKTTKFDKVVFQYQNLPSADSTEFEPGEFLPRRLTYVPPDLPQNIPGKRPKPWLVERKSLTLYPVEKPEKEWNSEPQYPKIIDDPFIGFFKSKITRLDWYEKIRSLPSIDEKLIEIVDKMDHRCVFVTSAYKNYGHLPMYQYLTRTHLIQNQLPIYYDSISVNENLIQKIKPYILDAIRSNFYETFRDTKCNYIKAHRVMLNLYDKQIAQDNFIQELNQICLKALSKLNPHLFDVQVDYDPEIRSWWWANHVMRPSNDRYFIKNNIEYLDQPMQYFDSATLNLRMSKPLKPIVSLLDKLTTDSDVPYYPYNPCKQGYYRKFAYLSSVPGYFNDIDHDPFEKTYQDFSFITFRDRLCLKIREKLNGATFNDDNDVLNGIAIMSSFGLLNALACYHGFTPFDEITYPFVNQHVITDGQNWFFSVYQMNSHTFHSDLFTDSRKNLCWTSGEMKLFEKYENGKFYEVNEEVLKILLKFYLNKPTLDTNINYQPYLGKDLRDKETKKSQRIILRERYCHFHTPKKNKLLKAMKVFPYEWIFFRNPNVPSSLHLRKPFKARLYSEEKNYSLFKTH